MKPYPALMTVLQAAKALGCGDRQVYRYIEWGELTAYQFNERSMRIEVRSVDALLERSRIKPKPARRQALR